MLIHRNRVGGVIGENSFKFFIQFVTYTALYCIFILVVMAVYIAQIEAKQVDKEVKAAEHTKIS